MRAGRAARSTGPGGTEGEKAVRNMEPVLGQALARGEVKLLDVPRQKAWQLEETRAHGAPMRKVVSPRVTCGTVAFSHPLAGWKFTVLAFTKADRWANSGT